MKIRKFSWEAMKVFPIYKVKDVPMHPSHRHNKKLLDNVTNYTHWVMNVLQEYADHSPCPGKEQWNALAIWMNEKNGAYLRRCFLPGDWINLSPKCDNNLKDDEFRVDEGEVIIECP